MSNTTLSPIGSAAGLDLLDTTSCARRQQPLVRLHRRTNKLAERGMSTAEYAVGILAAVTFALVLLRIFNDNRFFEGTFKIVLKILNWVSGRI